MNIYKRELKSNLKSLIIWSAVMTAMIVMEMQEYSSMTATDGAEGMMNIIDKMPGFIKVIWGISSLNITKPIGFFGVLFLYLILMSSIHSSMLGANIIAKEERDKTTEFLMTKPISRKKIITLKLLAGITNIIILNIITYIVAVLVLRGLTTDNITKEILLCMTAMFLIQTLFMTIGAGIALIMKNPKKAGAITMIILVGTFILSLIIDISDIFKILTILTPFKYFAAKDFMIDGVLNGWNILLTLFLIFIIMYFGYRKYEKRDLNI
jgi:ABC-2 type transport system permease protein